MACASGLFQKLANRLVDKSHLRDRRQNRSHYKPRGFVFESLEPRLLLSADPTVELMVPLTQDNQDQAFAPAQVSTVLTDLPVTAQQVDRPAIVINADDSGPGSLRQAILDANTAAGADTIQFDAGLSGRSISLTSGPLVIASDLTIEGLGRDALTVDGNGRDIFRIPSTVSRISAALTGTTLEGGDEGIQIDGDRNTVTLSNSRVRGNAGDGLRIDGSFNKVDVTNSTFEANQDNVDLEAGSNNVLDLLNSTFKLARQDGVVIGRTLAPGRPMSTGNDNTVTVQNCTISENGLLSGDPNDGLDVNGDRNAVKVQQVTISSNGEHGLDIEGGNNQVTVENSTLAFNGSDGLIIQDLPDRTLTPRTSTVFVKDSIIAGNKGERSSNADVFNASEGKNLISGGYNLVGNVGNHRPTILSFDGPGDQVGTPADPIDARLGPLQDNGGPTLTHALLLGSPAINGGDPNFAPPPDFDQRGPGFLRVRDGRIDIGALEGNPQFRVFASVRVVEAGEDGLDGDAEWRLDFFVNSNRVFRLSDNSVHDSDALPVSQVFQVEAPGQPTAPMLTLRTSGVEDDPGLFPIFDDPLPATRSDVTLLAPDKTSFRFTVPGENEEFAYVVSWQVEFLGTV
jgi:hypothetical protein